MAIISIREHTAWMISFASSRCNNAQKRNQCIPLKTACIKEVYFPLSKTKSLRHLHIS
uniref:Uncharacterized protein n=1 Tax=Arundo donax TaxID=35708 RepID=A0A0A9BLX3_ARUDO